jgi:hypothetical protein
MASRKVSDALDYALELILSFRAGVRCDGTLRMGDLRRQDLMARMGHDSERAALIYQHQARGADKIITSNIDAHVEAECGRKDDDDGTAGVLVPVG